MAALALMYGDSLAQNASPWIRDSYSALRLVGGAPETGAATRLAAIDISLNPGWKTYWRVPGDSGIPPQVDFSHSDNVAKAELLWPAPLVFGDGAGGQSIGYKGHATWPVRVTPQDPRKPVLLRADIHYAVCDNICVPAQAKAEIVLPATPGVQPDIIAQALGRVPVAAAMSDTTMPRLVSITRNAQAKDVLIEIAAPCPSPCAHPPVVLAEGPDAQWALPIPRLEKQDDIKFYYRMKLEGAPPGASFDGAPMKITLMNENAARAFRIRLD